MYNGINKELLLLLFEYHEFIRYLKVPSRQYHAIMIFLRDENEEQKTENGGVTESQLLEKFWWRDFSFRSFFLNFEMETFFERYYCCEVKNNTPKILPHRLIEIKFNNIR